MVDAEAEAFTFRPYTQDDIPFIGSSWASSYHRGNIAHKRLTPEDFHAFHRPIRERFFGRPSTAVIVCTPSDDPWLILGWVAVEQVSTGLILQYLYVKAAFKGQGIAAELIRRAIPRTPVFFTHLTDRAEKIMSKKPERFLGYQFTPHLC